MQKPFNFSAALQELLDKPAREEAAAALFDAYDLPEEERSNGNLLLIQLLDSAKGGSSTAIREIRSLLESGGSKGEEVLLIDDISS